MALEPVLIKPRTMKWVFAASLLNMQHLRVRANTGRLQQIQDKVSSGAICLPVGCCFSVLAL